MAQKMVTFATQLGFSRQVQLFPRCFVGRQVLPSDIRPAWELDQLSSRLSAGLQQFSLTCRAQDSERPVVGFCFSFPCEHLTLSSGKLIRWTKKFNNPGAVGEDPVRMLEEAFERIDFPVCFIEPFCRSRFNFCQLPIGVLHCGLCYKCQEQAKLQVVEPLHPRLREACCQCVVSICEHHQFAFKC